LPQCNSPTADSAHEAAAETYRHTQCNSKKLDEAQHYLRYLVFEKFSSDQFRHMQKSRYTVIGGANGFRLNPMTRGPTTEALCIAKLHFQVSKCWLALHGREMGVSLPCLSLL